MSEYPKITGTHLRRAAVVYVRQSSASHRVQSGRVPRGRQNASAVRFDPGGCTCAVARLWATSHERFVRGVDRH